MKRLLRIFVLLLAAAMMIWIAGTAAEVSEDAEITQTAEAAEYMYTFTGETGLFSPLIVVGQHDEKLQSDKMTADTGATTMTAFSSLTDVDVLYHHWETLQKSPLLMMADARYFPILGTEKWFPYHTAINDMKMADAEVISDAAGLYAFLFSAELIEEIAELDDTLATILPTTCFVASRSIDDTAETLLQEFTTLDQAAQAFADGFAKDEVEKATAFLVSMVVGESGWTRMAQAAWSPGSFLESAGVVYIYSPTQDIDEVQSEAIFATAAHAIIFL